MGKLQDKECAYCGKIFHQKHSYNKYCSQLCAHNARKYLGNGICKQCGKEFKIKNFGQKFCSVDCKREYVKLPETICRICGKKFMSTHRGQLFCGIACSNKARKRKHICLCCGNEFDEGYYGRKYCSNECRNKSRKRKIKKCQFCGVELVSNDRKYCSDECLKKMREKKRTQVCEYCGKNFLRTQGKQKFCSRECKNAAFRLPNKICPICGKEFHSNRNGAICCSRECHIKRWETLSDEDRQKKMAHLWNTPKTTISQPNIGLKKMLEEAGYFVELEYKLGGYSYDLLVGNILIEVNPYPYHNVTRYPYGCNNPVTKDYHYEKYLCAIRNGFRCIMVFDWTDKDEVLHFIENDKFHYEGQPRLHRYNPKSGQHILDNGHNRDAMVKDGFVEIYDCGEESFT